jgi:prepilin-type N-terminal cleavage/methylation domain-containing protein
MDRLSDRTIRARGFTLVEMMLASALLAIGLTSMLALQLHAMRGSQLGRHYSQAAQVARDQIELFERLDWDDPQVQPAAWTAPVAKTNAVEDNAGTSVEQSFDVSWRIAADPAKPTLIRTIDVRVTWYEPNDPPPPNPPRRRYAISSAKYNEG